MISESHNTNPKPKRSPAGNLSRCTAKAGAVTRGGGWPGKDPCGILLMLLYVTATRTGHPKSPLD